MAAVTLVSKAEVTDSWKRNGPVVQLILNSPNVSNSSDSEDQLSYNHAFPILAVSRKKKHRQSSNMTLRSPSLSSECSDSVEVNKSGTTSPNESRQNVVISTEKVSIRYSVQDLNKQMSIHRKLSPHSRVSSAGSLASYTAARLKLPKDISRKTDVQNFLNQNGFLRTSTLTPGELELKRFKDTHFKDHFQHNKKKFKMNVNQLPRSTTPINDHDPDKLNMKQVIAFLQDQAIRPSTGNVHFNSTAEKNKLIQSRRSPIREFSEKRTLKQEQCFSEPPSVLPSTSDIACYSVTSTPGNLKRIQNSARCGGARCNRQNTNTQMRPYSDIPGRYYRYQSFLSLEPNGFGLTTTSQYKIFEKYREDKNIESQELPVNYRSARFRIVKPNCEAKCNDKSSSGLDYNASFTVRSVRVSRSSDEESSNEQIKTEQKHKKKQSEPPVMNKHPSDSGISDISQSETKNVESSKSSDSEAIRMPSLDDFHDEWECNSDNEHDIRANETGTIFDPSKQLNIQTTDYSENEQKSAACSNRQHNISGSSKRPSHLSDVFQYIPTHRQHHRIKQINVELPHANGPEISKSDGIKLTMRQGNIVTRHTSYMSDMVPDESGQPGQATHLPIISIQDVHRSVVTSTLKPIREPTAIQASTLSVTFNKDGNEEKRSVKTTVEFDRIRKKKKSYGYIE